jgi:hypothetical protein
MPASTPHRLGLAALLLLGVVRSLSGEEAPPADSLATAKRQFETVKELKRELPSSAKVDERLLTLPAPSLDGSSAPLTAPKPLLDREKLEKLERKKRSSTWLLDAMEQEKKRDSGTQDPRQRLKKDRLQADRDAETEASDNPLALQEDSSGKEEPSQAEKAKTPAPDPFKGYLSSWLSPRDFELLAPQSRQQAPLLTGKDPSSTGPASLPTENLSGERIFFGAFGSGTLAKGLAEGVADNPYLKDFSRPGGGTGSPSLFQAPAPPPEPVLSTPAPSSFAAPSPPSPAQQGVAEKWRPSEDRKYFPQLKRF